MPVDDKWLLIRNYDLWAHLSNDEYEELKVTHNYIEAKRGEYVYFEAFNHNKLYFIKDGHIRIGYIDDDGNEIVKEIIRKGEIFGQITLEKNNLNGEFAQAHKSDVSLCAFTIQDFENILRKKPELALKFSKQVGTKLRTMEIRLMQLINKDVRARLLHFLLQLLPATLDASSTSFSVPNHFTHEDIASLIGSSRQTVTTLISELTLEGLVSFSRQEIHLPDVKKLQKLVTVV
ncbi:MAG: Crp/Fnr family transcriptional regulator [Chitinophagaceae bacterium]|nr:Crp/Fnr family transcriptional regulator [Chitinophagaceae bacterium]